MLHVHVYVCPNCTDWRKNTVSKQHPSLRTNNLYSKKIYIHAGKGNAKFGIFQNKPFENRLTAVNVL